MYKDINKKIHGKKLFFRFESYVDEKYKEFCRNQGKADDVCINTLLVKLK